MSLRTALIATLLLCLFTAATAQPTQPEGRGWALQVMLNYWVVPNVTYSIASGTECKLDVYSLRSTTGPVPAVLYIHGGGWVTGSKEAAVLNILPYLELGFSVVNVEYRLTKVAPAPAAVEDCRLALRWLVKNARTYNFDTTRIVVTGGSAGGHLALMTGMTDSTAGFDSPKEWDQVNPILRVAAIVNWYGITDVNDLLSGPNRQNYAVSWLGSQPGREELAKRVSPLTYVRKGLPPILTIHGTKDELVPYSHAVRLHELLNAKEVPNQLLTIPEGKHGGFSREEMARIYAAIEQFLKTNGIIGNR